jgi:hypothetical protein
MTVLKNAKKEDLKFRYTCLLHDLGKYGTGKINKRDGRKHISFINH